jgi:thiosulfate dehydrogenase
VKYRTVFTHVIFFSGLILITVLATSCNERNINASATDSVTVYPYADLFKEDWHAPSLSNLTHHPDSSLIAYGKELIVNTGKYFGPHGKISTKANGMNCQNCHLMAGTLLYANSFSAVNANYPKFRPRSGTVEHLEKRINDCLERSLNGNKIDSMSNEMRAMVTYINWVGKDVQKNVIPDGAAVEDLPLLSREADSANGRIAYEQHCTSCHKSNGEGELNADGSYLYPPLWGPFSYNTAAGLYRLSRFAGFIKNNMPYLTSTHAKPLLTNEEAWDIAAYVNSLPRPVKFFHDDWPDISKKPFDHPFGPFADSFSERQHKLGPFTEIKKAIKISAQKQSTSSR